MKTHKKVFWKVRNYLEVLLQEVFIDKTLPRGMLKHREDERDFGFEGKDDDFLGELMGGNLEEDFSLGKHQYNQAPFNDCVFASGTKACSDQDGINYSVRWVVKNARRMGYITGNGWSYLRAFLKVATKVGLLPYRLMPDETTGKSWNEYSKWTEKDTALLSVAENYKLEKYKGVNGKDDLALAIKHGYSPISGGKWYQEMNRPKAPGFLLRYVGKYLGGHAYRYTGWSYFAKYFETLQTFGKRYGKGGMAWLENPFNRYNQSAIYIISKLPLEKRIQEFKIEYEGKMVRTKTDPACYIIQGGKKRHIPTMEIFWIALDKIGKENFDDDVKQDVLDKIPQGDDYLEHK